MDTGGVGLGSRCEYRTLYEILHKIMRRMILRSFWLWSAFLKCGKSRDKAMCYFAMFSRGEVRLGTWLTIIIICG